jgi:K+-sensing histidine kinase KdpD
MKLFEYHLKIKNLKFCIENTINDEKLLVNNDKSKIERMIINLMSNAIKFTFIG